MCVLVRVHEMLNYSAARDHTGLKTGCLLQDAESSVATVAAPVAASLWEHWEEFCPISDLLLYHILWLICYFRVSVGEPYYP